ncbi:hypothetical protein LguiA_003276 [Lonicera macranthoides]
MGRRVSVKKIVQLSDARSSGHLDICKILQARGGIDPGALEVETQTPCHEIDHNEVNMKAANLIGQWVPSRAVDQKLKGAPSGLGSRLHGKEGVDYIVMDRSIYVYYSPTKSSSSSSSSSSSPPSPPSTIARVFVLKLGIFTSTRFRLDSSAILRGIDPPKISGIWPKSELAGRFTKAIRSTRGVTMKGRWYNERRVGDEEDEDRLARNAED